MTDAGFARRGKTTSMKVPQDAHLHGDRMFPRFASLLLLALCSSNALATGTAYRPAFHRTS